MQRQIPNSTLWGTMYYFSLKWKRKLATDLLFYQIKSLINYCVVCFYQQYETTYDVLWDREVDRVRPDCDTLISTDPFEVFGLQHRYTGSWFKLSSKIPQCVPAEHQAKKQLILFCLPLTWHSREVLALRTPYITEPRWRFSGHPIQNPNAISTWLPDHRCICFLDNIDLTYQRGLFEQIEDLWQYLVLTNH